MPALQPHHPPEQPHRPTTPLPLRAPVPQLSGAIIAPVGLAFLIYALYQYRLRTYQILRRETARYGGWLRWCAAADAAAVVRAAAAAFFRLGHLLRRKQCHRQLHARGWSIGWAG